MLRVVGLRSQSTDPSVRKPFLMCVGALLFAFVTVYVIGYTPNYRLTLNDVLALALTGLTGAAVFSCLFNSDQDGIVLELSRPFSLYSCFFLFYYVLPNWLVILSSAPARNNALEISGMTAVALFATSVGYRLSGHNQSGFRDFQLSKTHVETILFLVCISIPFTVWYYAWHISIGAFYTHARDYTQDPTPFSAFMENFAGQLQMPALLMLGVTYVSTKKPAVKRLLYCYAGASALVSLVSSQFRMLAGTILFLIVAVNTTSKRPLRLRAYFLAASLAAISLCIILAVRTVALHDDWSASENQLADSMSALIEGSATSSDIQRQTFDRALNQQNLLSNIIDSVHMGHPFLKGELLLASAYSVVPRFIWSEKPVVMPMQRAIRKAFNLSEQDDSPGPLLEFYANAGWVGVTLGYMAIGFSFGWLTKVTAKRKTTGFILALCFYWSVTSIMEGELALSLAAAFRLVIILAYCGSAVHQVLLLAKDSGRVSDSCLHIRDVPL